MSRPAYRFFTPLNDRRHALILKKYAGGLSPKEECELAMLQGVIGLMVEYASPLGPTIKRMEDTEKKFNEILLRATMALPVDWKDKAK